MDIYHVIVECVHGTYKERIERLKDMKEQEESYSDDVFGLFVWKFKIGKIYASDEAGTYHMYVLDEAGILDARKQLHQKVLARTKADFDAAQSVVLTDDITICDF